MADQVVGRGVQAYDPPPRPPAFLIPGMRPAPGAPPGGRRSATPIYDALYAEYRRSFRALPGDRSGEEEPDFHGSSGPHGHRDGRPGSRHAVRDGRPYHGDPPHALPPGRRDDRPPGGQEGQERQGL